MTPAAIVPLLDLTSLQATDTAAVVEALVARAITPAPGVPACAAVCVYPSFVPVARRALGGSGVKLASVAGAFPHGQAPLSLRLAEVRWCVEQGADEIDTVIPRGLVLAGEDAAVVDDLAAQKAAAGPAKLKVILETGELPDAATIRRAADLAIAAGADTVKTSTGKVQPAATFAGARPMLEAIRDAAARGRVVGFKPAGGIRTGADARAWVALVREVLGDAWIHPDRLRLGASALLDDLVAEAGGRA